MLSDSSITWVNQPEPRGFGDAVLRARGFVGSDHFLLAAVNTALNSCNLSFSSGLNLWTSM